MGRTQGERVWHSRPLLEVVPRNQSFVYHSSDHPMLQSPLPVQHTSSLEQLLLQLLWGGRCLIRGRPRPGATHPATLAHRLHLGQE